MSRPQLFDVVRLIHPLPELGFESGQKGTIVEEYTRPREAYEVEFIDDDGATIDLFSLTPDQFEVVVPWHGSVPTTRQRATTSSGSTTRARRVPTG